MRMSFLTIWCLYHLTPASHVAEVIMCSKAPSLHGRYPASSLLRTSPPPSRLSTHFPVLPVIEPTLLRPFPIGTRTASPVARSALVTVLSLLPRRSVIPQQSVCDITFCLRPQGVGSAFGVIFLRGHLWVHLRYGPVTHSPPQGRLCQPASSALFPPRM